MNTATIGTDKENLTNLKTKHTHRYELGFTDPLLSHNQTDTETPKIVTTGRLEIKMFGKFSVKCDGDSIELNELVQRKPGKLLAYIALNTGSAIARDTLLRQLWPQMSTRRSCDSFYAAWSRLTRTLKNKEGNYILSDSNMLRLNTSTVTTDVGTFKNLYRELIFSDHSLETKINILIEMDKLYSTGLLPGFLFDTYIMIHQQRYRLLMVEAMLTGAKLLLEQEQRLQAQWFALRACEIDPEHEEVFRILSETNGERHFNLTKSEFLLG